LSLHIAVYKFRHFNLANKTSLLVTAQETKLGLGLGWFLCGFTQ